MNHFEADSEADGDDQMTAIGRRRFIRGVGLATGAVAIGALPAGLANAAPPSGASRFVPLPKGVRLADTRFPSDFPFTRLRENLIRVQVRDRDDIPADATSVVLTVTGKNLSQPNNYITVFPTSSDLPVASNLNLPRPQETNANLVFIKVGDKNSVDVYQYFACHVIVDVLGYFTPVDTSTRAGRFVGLAEARRALDTRPNFVGAGSFTTVDLTGHVPAEAASVVINLTSLANPGWGFFTAVPYSVTSTPVTSSLNVVYPGDKRAAAVIVPVETVGGRRLIKIYAYGPAKLLVDVAGYFTDESASLSLTGLFVPTTPTRVLDTRQPDPKQRLWPGWVVESPLPEPAATDAAAVVLNVTSARTRGEGFLTVSSARRPIPPTSNVNWVDLEATVPNVAITPITAAHGFQVFDASGGHVIADMAGYFTGAQRTATLPKYVNPAPPASPPPWTLRVPRIGLTSLVAAGNAVAVTDSGLSWHWAGTGYMGEDAHVAFFAHRTTHGGPYRYLHYLQLGDTWTVTTGDNREYTYRMVRRDLTNAVTANILAATRVHPGTTVSLIACTKTNWQPTSLSWRIVVTGELVSWREV